MPKDQIKTDDSRSLERVVRTQSELKEKVLKAANDNHIWVNAFSLIRPTEETYRNIGKAVVEMLQTKENLLPHYYGEDFDGAITDLQKLTPVLYMSVNAS